MNSSWWSVFFLFVVTFGISLLIAGVGKQEVYNPAGWSQIQQFLVAALQPDTSPAFLGVAFQAAGKTLAYGILSTFFSIFAGFFLGVLSTEIWWEASFPKGGIYLCRGIRSVLAMPRAIHEAIWGLILVNIIGLDPIVAVLAIAIPYSTLIAKVFAEILDETPRDAFYALLHSGIGTSTAFLYSILQQSSTNMLSYCFYRFECAIRSAVVLGIIGAGGLGYELLLSFQSLHYRQMWTLLFVQLFLTAITDRWSSWLRHLLGAPSRIAINQGWVERKVFSVSTTGFTTLGAGLSIVGLLAFATTTIGIDITKLWSARTIANWHLLVEELFRPQENSPLEQALSLIPASIETVAMSIVAITFATIYGGILSFLASSVNQTIFTKIRSIASGILLLIARTIPEPIWALLFLFGFFPGILPGALALGTHNGGILGKLMAEAIDNLDRRPTETLLTAGASSSQAFLYSTLPRVLPGFISYSLYRWEVCLRSTVIVGFVGAGGLGRVLTEQLSSFDYQGVLVTIGMIIILTWGVDSVSTALRRSLR